MIEIASSYRYYFEKVANGGTGQGLWDTAHDAANAGTAIASMQIQNSYSTSAGGIVTIRRMLARFQVADYQAAASVVFQIANTSGALAPYGGIITQPHQNPNDLGNYSKILTAATGGSAFALTLNGGVWSSPDLVAAGLWTTIDWNRFDVAIVGSYDHDDTAILGGATYTRVMTNPVLLITMPSQAKARMLMGVGA